MAAGPTAPFNPSERPALHLHDDAAWEAALAARDSAPAPRCAQDAANGLFVQAREKARGNPYMQGRLTKDDIWHAVFREPGVTQAAMQRAWKWALDTGLIRSGKHLASRRSYNLTPYYEWVI